MIKDKDKLLFKNIKCYSRANINLEKSFQFRILDSFKA